ncbi:MAG: hypothetical protein N2595_00740, partial [bacterium]|nr:hypothetical protein [bacterium]
SRCELARFCWRGAGGDMYGLGVSGARARGRVEMGGVRGARGSNGRRCVCVGVHTGVTEVVVSGGRGKGERGVAVRKPSSYLPAVPVEVQARGMTARVHLPHTTNVLTLVWDAEVRVDRRSETQAQVRAYAAMQNPPGGELHANGIMVGDQVFVVCQPAISSITYVARYLPIRLPVKVRKGRVYGMGSGAVDFSGPTARVYGVKAQATLVGERATMLASKGSVQGLQVEGWFGLMRPLMESDRPRDMLAYLLARIEGACTARAEVVAIEGIQASNILMVGRVETGRVEVVTGRGEAMGGVLHLSGQVRRVKVRDKMAWRWLYDVACTMTNADAGRACEVMQLTTNRVEGRFSGRVRVAGFGPRVSRFEGELHSSGGGVLFFPDAAVYLSGAGSGKGGKAGLQQRIIEMNVERLREYSYRSTEVVFSYDPETNMTILRFRFDGERDGDRVRFEIQYNGTWLDALRLGQLFK